MRKLLISAAAVVAATVSTGAYAGDLNGTGASTCANVSGLWNQSDAGGKQIMRALIGQWALGYFTGKNSELPAGQRRDLGGLDNDRTANIIVQVCMSNSSAYVYQVADAMFMNLPYLRASS